MTTPAYRRCRREQRAWRLRHELRATITDPETYRFAATVLGLATVIASIWIGVSQ